MALSAQASTSSLSDPWSVHIRAMLLQGLMEADFRPQSLLSQDAGTVDALDGLSRGADLRVGRSYPGRSSRRLCLDGSVSAARWERREVVLESE